MESLRWLTATKYDLDPYSFDPTYNNSNWRPWTDKQFQRCHETLEIQCYAEFATSNPTAVAGSALSGQEMRPLGAAIHVSAVPAHLRADFVVLVLIRSTGNESLKVVEWLVMVRNWSWKGSREMSFARRTTAALARTRWLQPIVMEPLKQNAK